ncbi:4,5-dihydroxyphthalate decarboxylase [Amycolatopsis jejuensis]|uniref:4,5-dihydroxyphthalate decarboxylase n=1 Tax=Amycolatopsis jejuensis TaxID=330084 RepID=UPI0005246FF9|nr:4,5-dihydroxyphthalate decarboxylase [Amycolatopsis jejuensis]
MIPLKVGAWRYDHTRALFDGTAKIAGTDATFESGHIVSEIFENMVRHRAYDAAELGLTFYLRTLDLPDPPFIAIPVFPNRHFRHSAIFVNTSSGIRTPQDLAGKTIGEFATYGHDAGIWPKGILSDDYGVKPEQSRWIVGGTNHPMAPFDFIPFRYPSEVDVQPAPEGRTLDAMLVAGEIDALITALVPQSVLNGSSDVAPLFPDVEAVEREYYARTGIYPIMHTVVIRRDLLAEHPELARAVYQGFCDAKDSALADYRRGRMEQQMDVMVPWFDKLFEKNHAAFPENWWDHGLAANRENIDTFLRYSFEQGLSKTRLTCEDIFVPDLLDT